MEHDPSIVFQPELRWDGRNLLYKAFEVLENAAGHTCGHWKIHLKKTIPTQSGLGGGSADAAVLLRFLCRRFGLDPHTEWSVAKRLGADVPFFLLCGTAIGEENGSALSPLPPLPALPVLLVQPPYAMSTAKMYEQYDQMVSRSPNHPLREDRSDQQTAQDVYMALAQQLPVISRNDFEEVALTYYPEYRVFHSFFSRLGEDGMHRDPAILLKRMSGSGSAHYVVFKADTDPSVLARYESLCRGAGCWATLTRFSRGDVV